MRQLKILFFIVLVLTFLGGIGTGAWIGTILAQPPAAGAPGSIDVRVAEFVDYFDLSPTQARQLRDVLTDFDRQRLEIRQLTPEQFRRMRALEDQSRGEIRDLLTDAQKGEYDKLKNRR